MSEQQKKFNFNPKEMSPEEISKIPEEEKKELAKQVGEDDCIFDKKTGDFGPYDTAPDSVALGMVFNFYQALVVAHEAGYTHLVFGGFQFKKTSNGITRTPYKGKQSKGGGKRDYAPKYLDEVYMGDWGEVNEKLLDKNQNWSLGYPAIVMGDKFLIVKYK